MMTDYSLYFSALDDKLREILSKEYYRGLDKKGWSHAEENEDIAKIHQAFAEAGWIDTWKEKNGTLMNGKVWLERFEKELKSAAFSSSSVNVKYDRDVVLAVGRRASGVSDE